MLLKDFLVEWGDKLYIVKIRGVSKALLFINDALTSQCTYRDLAMTTYNAP